MRSVAPRERTVGFPDALSGQTTIWDAIARNAKRAPPESPPHPGLETTADQVLAVRETHHRQPAIRASKRLRRYELAFKRELDEGAPLPPMPASDAACAAMGLGTTVPCPYVRCRDNLCVEVTRLGSLRVIYPWWEPGVRTDGPTCAVAEARKGEHTAAQIGARLGIGVNRVGQVEATAMAKLAARFGMTAEQLRLASAASRRGRDQE
jgi:hypothetical protein